MTFGDGAKPPMEAGITYRTARALVVGTCAILVAGAFATIAPHKAGREQPPTNVTVIYVGADDCAPCRTWRRDRWPQFSTSLEFKRIVYREVSAPKLFDLLKDENWPDDLRRYRETLDRSAGVPLWLVVADDKLVLTARGLREWSERAVPKIRSLTH